MTNIQSVEFTNFSNLLGKLTNEIKSALDHYQKKDVKSGDDFEILELFKDLITYLRDKKYDDYKQINTLLREIEALLLNYSMSLGENPLNDIKQQVYIKVKKSMGEDYEKFIDFRLKSRANFIAELEDKIKNLENAENLESLNSELTINQYLYNKIILDFHYRIVDKNSELQPGLKDRIKLALNETIDNNIANIKLSAQNLELLNKLIWSKDIEYQYELDLVQKKIQTKDKSSYLQKTLKKFEKASADENVDKTKLNEALRLFRTYIDSQTQENLSQLNDYLELNFPKESKLKYSLQALLIAVICVTMLALAIYLSGQFGASYDGLIQVINQISSGLTSIYPPIKEVGFAIGNISQEAAFVIQEGFTGAVPIGIIASGAFVGTGFGLAAAKKIKKTQDKEVSKSGNARMVENEATAKSDCDKALQKSKIFVEKYLEANGFSSIYEARVNNSLRLLDDIINYCDEKIQAYNDTLTDSDFAKITNLLDTALKFDKHKYLENFAAVREAMGDEFVDFVTFRIIKNKEISQNAAEDVENDKISNEETENFNRIIIAEKMGNLSNYYQIFQQDPTLQNSLPDDSNVMHEINSILKVYEQIKDTDFHTLESLFAGNNPEFLGSVCQGLNLESNLNFSNDRIEELFKMMQNILVPNSSEVGLTRFSMFRPSSKDTTLEKLEFENNNIQNK